MNRVIAVIAVIVAAAILARRGDVLAAIGAGGFAAYLLALAARPFWDCPLCGGSKNARRRGHAFAFCPLCRGKGLRVRRGVKVLQPGRAERLRRQAGLPTRR
jgi:hypothetical protein